MSKEEIKIKEFKDFKNKRKNEKRKQKRLENKLANKNNFLKKIIRQTTIKYRKAPK
jgi:hypothetical protein